jgi:hypothetical protein
VRRIRALSLVPWALLLASPAHALEVRITITACLPGPPCWWSMRVQPDRGVTVDVYPAEHLSRKFALSRRQFAELQEVLGREDFFSLPDRVGALVPDGPGGEILVHDGSRQRRVGLSMLPYELRPIWRTDVGPLGRAFRVCEYLRSLTGVTSVMPCPGIPASDHRGQ